MVVSLWVGVLCQPWYRFPIVLNTLPPLYRNRGLTQTHHFLWTLNHIYLYQGWNTVTHFFAQKSFSESSYWRQVIQNRSTLCSGWVLFLILNGGQIEVLFALSDKLFLLSGNRCRFFFFLVIVTDLLSLAANFLLSGNPSKFFSFWSSLPIFFFLVIIKNSFSFWY